MSENVGTEGYRIKDSEINPHNCNPVLFSFKKGGVASGLKHTETNSYDVKRLLHVKGKKRVIANEVCHTLLNIMGHYGTFWDVRKRE